MIIAIVCNCQESENVQQLSINTDDSVVDNRNSDLLCHDVALDDTVDNVINLPFSNDFSNDLVFSVFLHSVHQIRLVFILYL